MAEQLKKSVVIPRNTHRVAQEIGQIVGVPEVTGLLEEALMGYTKKHEVVAAGLEVLFSTRNPKFQLLELNAFANYGYEMICVEQSDVENPLYGYRVEENGHQLLTARTKIISTNNWLPTNWGYNASNERYLSDKEYQIKYLRKMFFRYQTDYEVDPHKAQIFARIQHI